ncbi:MAG: ceramidase domain-containing protein [Bdellovibrionales bacterium]|nr:ceramidase domain-containing protein [Bdellovibrionales bacterium]
MNLFDFSHHPKSTLAKGCPWESIASAAPPNVKWCEESLCSWIAEPALTWSNLAYIVAGLIMIQLSRKLPKNSLIQWFGPAAILVGIGSGFYHASINFYSQLVDFFVMDVFCVLLILAGLRRLHLRYFKIAPVWILIASAIIVVLTVVMDQLHLPIQLIILAMILVITGFEIAIAIQDHGSFFPSSRSPYFFVSLLCFVAGITASTLDVTRMACNPENHVLQGHAVWHLMSALGLLFSFFHFRQHSHRI